MLSLPIARKAASSLCLARREFHLRFFSPWLRRRFFYISTGAAGKKKRARARGERSSSHRVTVTRRNSSLYLGVTTLSSARRRVSRRAKDLELSLARASRETPRALVRVAKGLFVSNIYNHRGDVHLSRTRGTFIIQRLRPQRPQFSLLKKRYQPMHLLITSRIDASRCEKSNFTENFGSRNIARADVKNVPASKNTLGRRAQRAIFLPRRARLKSRSETGYRVPRAKNTPRAEKINSNGSPYNIRARSSAPKTLSLRQSSSPREQPLGIKNFARKAPLAARYAHTLYTDARERGEQRRPGIYISSERVFRKMKGAPARNGPRARVHRVRGSFCLYHHTCINGERQ